MKYEVLEGVYPPKEDTWQTLRIAEGVLQFIKSGHIRAVEACSGTGIVAIGVINKAKSLGMRIWALTIDVDVKAVENTRLNVILNGMYDIVDVIACKGLSCIRPFEIDVLIMNPPYLPGDWKEDPRIFGGPTGVETALEILYGLNCNAHFVILTLSSFSNWEYVLHEARRFGYLVISIMSMHIFFEDIITMALERRWTSQS